MNDPSRDYHRRLAEQRRQEAWGDMIGTMIGVAIKLAFYGTIIWAAITYIRRGA